MKYVFIDGSAGTTGLRISQRLTNRSDIQLITLSEEKRKDAVTRRDALNDADVAVLCLPDDAAREAVSLVHNPRTVLIDTSTAHRTDPGWIYGFPELSAQRAKIASSMRIANPGCHATGFIALIAPLVQAGLLDVRTALSCFSLTGYSGGGKKMIAEYESERRSELLEAPRVYGLTQNHKHLPEMQLICGLTEPPVFCPIVAPYYAGMEVTVPLFSHQLKGDINCVYQVYTEYYPTGIVHYDGCDTEAGFLSAGAYAGRDDLSITVQGNEKRLLLMARFDNLGKGASGAALQNLNLVIGAPETLGLKLQP